MEALLGWLIIAVLLCLPGMALLWPALRLARRRFPGSRNLLWAYLAGTAGCGLALWYLVPLVVWMSIGRPPH